MITRLERIAGFWRGDLLRTMRLTFLLALFLVTGASLAQVLLLPLTVRAHTTAVVILAAVLALRVVEYRRARPAAFAVDAAELAAVAVLIVEVRHINQLLGTVFFLLLCRSSVAGLSRLVPLAAGYVGTWLTIGLTVPGIDIYPGAMISMPLVGLMVYAVRTLLTRLQEQHREQSALLDTVLRRLPYPVIVAGPDGAVVLRNPAAAELTGEAPLDGLDLRAASGDPVDLRELAVRVAAGGEGLAGVEVRMTRPDGSPAHVQVELVPMDRTERPLVVLALLDVTAQRLYEEQLQYTAHHDVLTGLPNRALLWQRFAALGDDPYAVLLIDLDDFKRVNDTLGHQAGDELLQAVAGRLREACGTAATVARLGGDEFAVVVTTEPAPVADAIRGCFTEAFALGDGPLPAGGTVGWAQRRPGQSPDDVMAAADRSMYRSKARSRRGQRAGAV